MSAQFPVNVLRYGTVEPLPEQVPLRAGPLSVIYEAGDLRYIKLDEREVIRRVYAAVRDRNWGTVPGVISDLKFQVADESFDICFTSEHRQNEIHFLWRGEISGEADGTVRFTFDGEAHSTFFKNRIGFCVLHSIRECAGMPCRVEYADGTSKQVSFPKLVAAEQPVPGIHDLRAIAHEVAPGVWAEVRFEGDLFEMEDQRNWIDASFKTFCTPLRLPFPVEVKAGTRIQQSVTLRLIGDGRPAVGNRTSERGSPLRAGPIADSQFTIANGAPVQAHTVELGPARSLCLPKIGLGAPSHNYVAHEREARRLDRLQLAHVRVDLRISEPNWPGALWLAAGSADAVERLELALHFPNISPMAMKDVARELAKRREQLVRVIVFQDGAKSTSERLMKLARKHLDDLDIPIGTGTNADFYQLNQHRPPAELCDFICWSMNPQVHAFDNASLAETPQAIPAQIQSAREYFPGKPLVVSPITLKPRFNPVATGPEPPVPPGALPPQVDPRQMSLIGAGWTLAALKHLAESGVESVTFYETTGWRGVMEREGSSPLPEKFPSSPGAVFPLYHVLADMGEFVGGAVVATESSDPLSVESLLLRKGGKSALLLANLTSAPQTVRFAIEAKQARVRFLDETNAEAAMTEPEKFRAADDSRLTGQNGKREVTLKPFGLARIDFAP